MRTLGNVLWLIFAGLWTAIEWALVPFGREVVSSDDLRRFA